MARKLELQMITPEGEKYGGRVEYVRLPGQDGAFGVMADHAPLIAALIPGEIVVTEEAGRTPRHYSCGGGVVEIRENRVAVLAESLELGPEIDVARAHASADRARRRLGTWESGVDRERAEAALARALARLRVSEKTGNLG